MTHLGGGHPLPPCRFGVPGYFDLGRVTRITYLTLEEAMHSLGHLNRTIDIF
jgi:hypothetical protein